MAQRMAWGINAITLRPAYSNTPDLALVLTNRANTVSLDRFYRVGGTGAARAQTECRLACDSNSLIVVFRCSEPDLSFPQTNRNANWYSLLTTPFDQDSSFPDKVDLFIRPDMRGPVFYQFTATLAGLKFGCQRQTRFAIEDAEEAPGRHPVLKVNAFAATVAAGTNEWTVFIRIPWKTLGGRPRQCFGLLPMRTRWRDGEISSPVAFDFTERPPLDLFIETHFANAPGKPSRLSSPARSPDVTQQTGRAFQSLASAHPEEAILCRLPSGVPRWQRPALLTYPGARTLQAIWQMEQSLDEPTRADNFATRLWLTQRWTDVLTLEGFNFRLGRGSIVTRDLSPYQIRRRVNFALLKGQTQMAWRSLDAYLHQLDAVSRIWFADGSPGDIGQWSPVSRLTRAQTIGNVLRLHCLADGRAVILRLSLPKSGGIHICGRDEGYFKPAELLPLKVIQSPASCSIVAPCGRIVIGRKPFVISFYDTAGNLVTGIGANDLAFRFIAGGRILAVDFMDALGPNEGIYGFGERYDRFDENGNVLTLWDMDDW
ncbi:MAG: hypothetical protein ACREE6_10645, partial [Limisphaerales bacterium]